MIYQKAKISDLDIWVLLRSRLWPSVTRDQHRKELYELLSDNNFHAWIAENNGNPIGFLEAYLRPFANGCDERPVPFLEGIWVEPEFRRQRVSTQLISVFEKWAIAQGYCEIGSDTEIENRDSITAHHSWGFEETERVVYFRKKLKN